MCMVCVRNSSKVFSFPFNQISYQYLLQNILVSFWLLKIWHNSIQLSCHLQIFSFPVFSNDFKISLCILLKINRSISIVGFLKNRLSIVFFRLNNRFLVRILLIIFISLSNLNILAILIFINLSILTLSHLLTLWFLNLICHKLHVFLDFLIFILICLIIFNNC